MLASSLVSFFRSIHVIDLLVTVTSWNQVLMMTGRVFLPESLSIEERKPPRDRFSVRPDTGAFNMDEVLHNGPKPLEGWDG